MFIKGASPKCKGKGWLNLFPSERDEDFCLSSGKAKKDPSHPVNPV